MKYLNIDRREGEQVTIQSTNEINIDIQDGCLIVTWDNAVLGFEADEWVGFLGYER